MEKAESRVYRVYTLIPRKSRGLVLSRNRGIDLDTEETPRANISWTRIKYLISHLCVLRVPNKTLSSGQDVCSKLLSSWKMYL